MRAVISRTSLILVVTFLLFGGTLAARAGEANDSERLVAEYEQVVMPFLSTYCVECHGAKKAEEDLNYERLARSTVAIAQRDLWRLTARKITQLEMPPERRKQPSVAERQAVLAWVAALRRSVPPDPGSSGVRRLSTNEYRTTIQSLFGQLPASAADIPDEVIGAGFNSAISPLLMEQYLTVADDVLAQVIKPDHYEITWPAATLPTIPATKPVTESTPITSRTFTGAGELTASIHAPTEGTYTLTVLASEQTVAPHEPALLRVRINDQTYGEIALKSAKSRPYRLPLKLVPGRLVLSLQIVNPVFQRTAETATKKNDLTTPPAGTGALITRTVTIDSLAVSGPPAAQPSAWQREWFGKLPGKDLSRHEAASTIARRFAERAFRRPVAQSDVDHLLSIFDLADAEGVAYAQAITLMLKAVLISPQFLYLGPESTDEKSSGVVPLSAWQLASRLSYLLWSAPPDDELLAKAADGSLRQSAVLVAQAHRLLDDPRSRALFFTFGAQWLGVDALQPGRFAADNHPQVDDALRQAMYDEVALFFDGVVRERRSLLDFVNADYTYLNGLLAKTYGMPNAAQGPQWKRVTLTDGRRRGVMTMPGILTITSQPNRTSPVKRGIWVLQTILGAQIPPPPMNVPALEEQNTPANAMLSLRQRSERHRSDPACAHCHRLLDPIGFGLESFDLIGRWREADDTGATVDASGELPGQQNFTSTTHLLTLLAERREEVCRNLAERFLAFALCRPLQDFDAVVVDRIVAATAKDDYRFRTLLTETITSYPFLHRRLTP